MKTKIGILVGIVLAGMLFYKVADFLIDPFKAGTLSTTKVHRILGRYGLHDIGFNLDDSDQIVHTDYLSGISDNELYLLQLTPDRVRQLHNALNAEASKSEINKDPTKIVRKVDASKICALYPSYSPNEIPKWWVVCEKTPMEFENWAIEYHRSGERNDFHLALSISKDKGSVFIYQTQGYPQGYPQGTE